MRPLAQIPVIGIVINIMINILYLIQGTKKWWKKEISVLFSEVIKYGLMRLWREQ